MAGETARDGVRVAAFSQLAPETAYRLWALRSEVFVVEQDCPYLDLDGRDLDPTTVHLWVEVGGEPVATLRLLEEGHQARIARVATRARHRGEGLATALVEAALARCDGRDVVLDAQAHLVDWYAGLGFVPSGRGFVEDGIPHVPMRHEGTRDGG
jgi:ElaA protein